MQAPERNIRVLFERAVVLLSLCLLAACAGTPSASRKSAHLEIQEDVGFTIVEQARIGANVRADYESALTLLEQGRHDEGVSLLEDVAERAPQFSAPRIDLGVAYHRAGDLEAAERNLLIAFGNVDSEWGAGLAERKGSEAEAR